MGTLPGVGGAPDPNAATAAPAAAADSPRRDAAVDATLPANDAVDATLAASSSGDGTEDTLAGPPAHAATLRGGYKVADLPSLPRVDDATYAIGDEIARGGMGKILAARDRRLRREVVIKVMRRESGMIDPRFEREALITARLQHPSIVRVYDAGVLGDGRAFYAMERVRGRSLEVVLEEAKTLRDRMALLPHAIAVCDALAYAHNEAIVHRDLKPSNVLLGPFGETVVIDWGLAKDLRASDPDLPRPATDPAISGGDSDSSSSDLTQHGAVMGTPSYMAPEQARGEVADERTDIYALGALLYTVLTGVPPHRGTSSDEVIGAVAAGRRTPIGEVEPELPPELVSIVEHAMAHERADRYSSAKELADELRAFAAGKLVTSHAYSTWQLVERWIARNRVPVGIGLAAIVLVAVTGVLAVRNVLRERDIAQHARLDAENKWDEFAFAQAVEALRLPTPERPKVSDPSLSAGWLKKLSNNALAWPKVRVFIGDLRTRGLAHELRDHREDIELVVASPDGIHVASASDDATVRWWDLRTRRSVELTGHTGPIEVMELSTDGKYLATGGTDHVVFLWDANALTGMKLVGHGNTVRGFAFSPDQRQLASTSEDGGLWVWDVATGTGSEVAHYTHSLRAVIWLDNTTVLVGAFDGKLGRIDLATKQATWSAAHKAEIRCLAVTPNHDYILVGDEDGRVTLWTFAGQQVRELKGHNDVARELIVTLDGRSAISGGGDDSLYVHNIPDGSYRKLLGSTSGTKDLQMDRSGTLIASAGIDGVVRVWRIADGVLLHAFRGHRGAVKGVTFAGKYVVSSSEDDTVRVWPLDGAPPPPPGIAVRDWLDAQTNVEAQGPR